jgi:hypothetical protein
MQTLESLNMSLSTLKSLLSDYALRASQAEAITGRLLSEKLSPEQFREVLKTMSEQMGVRANERSVHQQALIQATLLSLESALRGDEPTLREAVREVTKQLTTAQSHMNTSTQANTVNTDKAISNPNPTASN